MRRPIVTTWTTEDVGTPCSRGRKKSAMHRNRPVDWREGEPGELALQGCVGVPHDQVVAVAVGGVVAVDDLGGDDLLGLGAREPLAQDGPGLAVEHRRVLVG
jgi:hypothetical protein